MDQQTGTMIKSGVIATILALVLYKMGVSSPLFILPLLFFAPKFKPNIWAVVPVALVLAILLAYNLIGTSDLWRSSSTIGVLLVGLYFPISSLVGAGIWILLGERRMLTKLLSASAFATAAGFGLVYWLSLGGPVATATGELYQRTIGVLISTVFGGEMPMGLTTEAIFQAIVSLLKRGFLPMFVGQFGFCALLSTILIHRGDSSFQARMTNWKLSENFVWLFLGAWSLVLVSLVVKIPFFDIVGWNVALATTLLYMVQGVSIVAMFFRRKNPNVTATRVFVLALISAFLPGINLVIWLALPILGVGETWINFRKKS